MRTESPSTRFPDRVAPTSEDLNYAMRTSELVIANANRSARKRPPAGPALRRGQEDALLQLCAAPRTTVSELARFKRIPATTLRVRLEKLVALGLADTVSHVLSALGPKTQHRYFPTEKGTRAAAALEGGIQTFLADQPVSRQWFGLLTVSDQATRRAIRTLGHAMERPTFFAAIEGEQLAGGHRAVIWQECGHGMEVQVKIDPHLSLENIIASIGWLVDRDAKNRRNRTPPAKRGPMPTPYSLYPSHLRAAMPDPPEQVKSPLAIQLTRAEKEALDLLAAWPLCTTASWPD